MEVKSVVCKIKRIIYNNEELYVGYIEGVKIGELSEVNNRNVFVTHDNMYECGIRKIVKDCKKNNYCYRAFTTIHEKNFPKLNKKFVVVNVSKQEIEVISDLELLGEISKVFNNSTYNNSVNEPCILKLNHQNDIEGNYLEILKTIKGQDEQVKNLITSLYFNKKLFRSKSELSQFKQNILIKGGTGTGKTEMIRQIANMLNVPLVKEDATTYTVSGYVGNSIEDMFRQLYLASGKDLELAQKGILVIDEFDKLASTDNKAEVKYLGVQKSLLTVLEGGKIYIPKDSSNPVGGFSFDTSKVTVIALGAFDGIDKIIEKRLNKNSRIGFEYNTDKEVSDSCCIPKDFTEYGIMSQLIGRFSQIIEMNPLNKQILSEILTKSKSSPLNFYKEYLKELNVSLSWTDDFIVYVVNKAYEQNCGARSLKTIVDSIINPYLYDALLGKINEIELGKEISKDNDSKVKIFIK